MAPQTTTGIVLERSGGMFRHQGRTWEDTVHLDAVSADLGLQRGYWLRRGQTGRATTYTWVQL